ncbi:MAG: Coq4 family protein [Oceanicaulis sp.]
MLRQLEGFHAMAGSAPRYPYRPVRPLAALKAFYGLTQDRDDTRYVFAFFEAVNGRSQEDWFDAFFGSAYGQSIVADHERVGRVLTDRERLESCGPGTFASAYLQYLDSEGLHPTGVHDAHLAQAPEDMARLEREHPHLYALSYMMALTHDLYHVLTGYSRDPLGEALLLVFTGCQTGSRGSRLLGAMAGLRIRAEIPSWPMGRMMKEAVRLAHEAENFAAVDLLDLLPLPLEEARRRLNVGAPELYRATREAWSGPEPVTTKAA